MDRESTTVGRAGFVAFWFLMAGLLIWNAWSGSQFPSDDCIYAQIGREVLKEGRWLDPTWQDAPFLDKGPVLPWALAGSMAMLGESELALRLPGILAAMLLLACLYRVGRRLGLGPPGAMTAVALAISSGVFYMTARRPMTDVPAMALGLAGFLLAAFPGRDGRDVVRSATAGVLLGLSMLTKLTGPFPFVMGLVAMQAFRDFRRPRRLAWTLAAAGLIAVPWHAWMIAVHGRAFIDTYLLFHVVERVVRPVVGDAAFPTYLAWIMGHESLSAIMAVISIPVTAVLVGRRNRAAVCAMVLGAGAAVPLLASATSLPHYLAAVVPPIALSVGLMADRLDFAIRNRSSVVPAGWTRAIIGGIFALAFLANNSSELVSPDHGPGAKAACAALRSERVAARLTATFDLHDTCVPWYCDSRVGFYGADSGFLSALGGIPMLRGFVHAMNPRVLRGLADTGVVLMTRVDRLGSLREIAERAGVRLKPRTYNTRVVVELSE